MPTSTRVQAIAGRTTSVTGAGNSVMESPKFMCANWFRYWPYWLIRLPEPSPSSLRSASASPGGTVPDWVCRSMISATGSPGISRGRKKLTVTATQAAAR
jgi:hypothetical protein